MKVSVNIARIIVGALFIFSGLVKAIDPLGLAYKMEEFFEVWAGDGYFTWLMNSLHHQSLLFSIVMIMLEVTLGVALLAGWQKKLVLNLLLLLMLFFTFLTSYVLFSGKIRSCGCFGDCIPLTPIQTFTKDIILLLLVIFLLLRKKYIMPWLKDPLPLMLVLIAILGTILLQMHVLKYLPTADCLPYKKGNDILELRKMPAGAVQDKYAMSFVYEKNGEKKEFTADKLPDSTWKFSDRKQTLIEKGKNNVPKINDFSLSDADGNDSTEAILNKPAYYLLFLKEIEKGSDKWLPVFTALIKKATLENKPVYIVTSDTKNVQQYFHQLHSMDVVIYTCDVTAIKTAARANPTLLVMKGPVVQEKYSWADMAEAVK